MNFIILRAASATFESAFLLVCTIVCTHCLPIRKQNHSVLKVAPAARRIIKFTQGSLFLGQKNLGSKNYFSEVFLINIFLNVYVFWKERALSEFYYTSRVCATLSTEWLCFLIGKQCVYTIVASNRNADSDQLISW